MTNFSNKTGVENIKKPIILGVAFFIAYFLGTIIANKGVIVAGVFIMLPFVLAGIIAMVLNPKSTLIITIILGFTAIGLTRYVKGVPLGLAIDGVLILGYVNLFFIGWKKQDWSPAKDMLTLLAAIWMAYITFELVNPEMRSAVAWFYAMRGISFYMLLTIPLAFILFNKKRDLETFLGIWMIFSILASVKGLQQLIMGPDFAEQAWLDEGASGTHILFGKLRVFSFLSDAGQFGAAQAQVTLVAGIIAIGPGSRKKKIFFATASALAFIGMMISGTRGAIVVPATGVFIYLFLSKKIKILILGIAFGAAVFVVMKYTLIGQSIPQVARMRTAFDPNDASLQVRLENQKKLASYLSSRPIGGGVGSAGNWGLRFSPNTFLAQTPTDSWYVKIWAETGVVGLTLHLMILFFILLKSGYIIWLKLQSKELIQIMLALISGYFGIMVASYGNGILGQMPTAIVIYLSWVFLFLAPKLDKEYMEISENEIKK